MTAIHETAYPRLKTEYSLEELTAVYTPSTAEIEYVFNLYRQVGPRTFMLVKLKLLQRLGYFVPLATVPEEIIEHICSQANLRKPAKRAITARCQLPWPVGVNYPGRWKRGMMGLAFRL